MKDKIMNIEEAMEASEAVVAEVESGRSFGKAALVVTGAAAVGYGLYKLCKKVVVKIKDRRENAEHECEYAVVHPKDEDENVVELKVEAK